MPASILSLLDFQGFTSQKFEELFSLAESLRTKPRSPRQLGETLALLFFEPSTRTRMSFESAAFRVGLGPLVFDGGHSTSLEKGETVEDSILNVDAMNPRFVVVRCGKEVDLAAISRKMQSPVINAGWGVQGHPTQGLLDALTMRIGLKGLQGKKLLIVGDIKHSRVASSHFEMAKVIGYEIAQCGPKEFLREGEKTFSSLKEGLQWADAVMALRFQFERHDSTLQLSKEDFRAQYGLSLQSLKALRPDGLVMHPGPINHGIELETEVLEDSRSQVLKQVQNGVFMREAILRWMLGERA